MTEKLLIGLIGTSMAGGFAILAFCCLSWIFHEKYGARSRKNGWILIAVCLLLPLNLVTLPHAHTIQLPNLVIRQQTPNTLNTSNTEDSTPQPEQKTNMETHAPQPEPHKTEISTEKILFLFWFAGVFFLTAYHFIAYQKMCHRVKRQSHDCQDKTVQKTAADITAEIGLKKIPTTKSIAFDSPFTMGIIRTNVYIPDEAFFEKDLYYILKHELTHCKEQDISWKLLFLTVNIIHWFNPLVWLMRKLAENDIEQVCDETVLKNASKEERREYSEVIMSWVERNGQKQSPVATGYMTGMVFLKWRFANIFDTGNKENGAILFGAMCVLILLFGGAVNIRASETIYRIGNIPIDGGIEPRTDLDGDGIEDRVRTIEVRDDDRAYTRIIANVGGADVAVKDYEGYYVSGLRTGDLTGNGKADVVLTRAVFGSTYRATEISVLYLEDNEWKEYPNKFIHNPNISEEQPDSFDDDESWWNGDLFIEGAKIIEKNGKIMIRFYLLLPEEGDETVKILEASHRDEGWYIENVEVVDDFYSNDYIYNKS